ncbi:MAG: lipoprotein transmembrane [Burkholderiales bacterium PBB3]|nr:MAG: lipoprotein transmembrane [Burkholderiales bacterium PBB3]
MSVGKLFKLLVPSFALTIACALPAVAATVDGVKIDDTTTVAGKSLVLNGAGMRKKFVFNVYVAGLYVAEKKSTPADVQALTTPKRVTLILQREVSSAEFGQLFITSINKNSTKEEKDKVISQTGKFGEMFAAQDKVKKGDVITMDWIPGQGTVSSINGKAMGEPMPDIAFYNAVLRIWLGDNPAQDDLKDAMLGKK